MSAESSPSRIHRDFRPWRRRGVLPLVRVTSAALAFATVSCWAAVSGAQAAEPPISWDAPAECSDVHQVTAIVAELTGNDRSVVARGRRIRGVVQRRDRGWQVSLTLLDVTRERPRVIIAPSCSELLRAAGVAIALALDPDGAAEPASAPQAASMPEAASGSDAGGFASSATAGHTALDWSAAGPARVAVEWRLEAAALLDAAALGGTAPGSEVSLGARQAELSGRVYGAALFPQRGGVEGGGSVEFSLIASGLRGCYELAQGLLGAEACAGVELGRLAASGERLANAASFADWWLAPSLGVALGTALAGPLYVRAGADAVVPLLREAYRVNDGELVHRPPSVGLRGSVALGVVLGGGG